MNAKNLSTVTSHVVESYGNTAKNVIHAYRAGGERMVTLVEDRWNSALKESRSKLAAGVAKNATTVQKVLCRYSRKGLTMSSGGAQTVVNKVVKLADAGIHSAAFNADRLEAKMGVHPLSTLAKVALPGAVVLNSLATQVEQKSADLANRVAGDNVVVAVAKRVRTVARKPRAAKPAAKAAPVAEKAPETAQAA
jgi:hypothetical protein